MRFVVPSIFFALTGFLVQGSAAGTNGIKRPKIQFQGEFAPFAMCMSKSSPSEQIGFCQKAGFGAMGIVGMDSATISRFAGHPDVVSGRFRILSTLWWFDPSKPVNTMRLDAVLRDASRMNMAIWLVGAGTNRSDSAMSAMLESIASVAAMCKAKKVQLVLYPHKGCMFETAEQALVVRDSLAARGFPEVGISMHLAHELLAGNRGRLGEIATEVVAHLSLVTINGADDRDPTGRGGDWGAFFKPLYRGSFDPGVFLQALADAGYHGPVQLHTWSMKSPAALDYDRHLELSLEKWRTMVVAPVPERPKK